MKRILEETAGTACAAALAAGLAGLLEGTILAIFYDPFEATWASRIVSVVTFLIAYLAVGFIAGVLLGLPLHILNARLRAPAVMVCGSVCGILGLIYARLWVGALRESLDLDSGVAAALLASSAAIFLVAGILARRALRHRRPRSGAAALAAVALWVAILPQSERLAPAPRPVSQERPAEQAPARNVLFILADTLRADHMSLHGYARATSPSLDRFARGGASFGSALVQKTKTSPSVASLFTGTYPHTHGIVNCRTALPDEAVTLAELLRERGFSTHSIVANSNVGAAFNFDQGFEQVEELWAGPGRGDARGVTDRALRWLESRAASQDRRRFFLYVHYVDPHVPYAAPAPFADMFVDDALYGRHAHIRVGFGEKGIGAIRPSARLPSRPTDVDYYVARYDGEIAYLDSQVERLLAGLDARGLTQETLVIFTSDHGEALSEHDVFFSHGEFAYEDTARVPLILRLPGRIPAGRVIQPVVEVTALAPTVLRALGVARSETMEVADIWDLAVSAGEGAGPESGDAFVEAGTLAGALRTSIRTDRSKLIENPAGFDPSPGRYDLRSVMSMNRKQKALELVLTGRQFLSRFELYDLQSDPGERANLALREPVVREQLLGRLRAWRERGEGRKRLAPALRGELPDEVIRNLKSLGYIN